MSRLNLAMWIGCTHSEGPGPRFALWTQGCLLRCPGCCNPQMWPLLPRHVLDAAEVMAMVDAARREHGIEGVTFLGGEPFLQARGLAELARRCRAAGLTVMVFTGFWREQLVDDAYAGASELLAACDLLVDGPFLAAEPETERNWAGSRNPRFHFLTGAYTPGIERDPRYRPSAEVRIGPDGMLRVNGWPVELVDGTPEPADRPGGVTPGRAPDRDPSRP